LPARRCGGRGPVHTIDYEQEFGWEAFRVNRPFFPGAGLPTGKVGGIKFKTFAGKDERDIENQILKWRANNPHVAVEKVHPFRKTDPVGNPSFRFLKATDTHGNQADRLPGLRRGPVGVDFTCS
jgi:hypothetical protein